MRHALASLLASALLAALPLAGSGACGGKVVVDAPSSGGTGGAGGAGGAGQGGTVFDGVGGALGNDCGFPVPVGVLINCGGSAVAGSGGPMECAVDRCDGAKNRYSSDCFGTECKCSYQPAVGTPVGCSCTLPSACTFGGGDCCPFHQ